MATITHVDIPNAALDGDPVDLGSITEYRDFPRKAECLPDENGDGLTATLPDYRCQRGCGNEPEFAYIVEPGDIIRLQFHAPDYVNADPLFPSYGWREASAHYMIGLEILDLDGNVLWSGPTNNVATAYHIGTSPWGPYQNIDVLVDNVLQLNGNVQCFAFRAKVFTFVPEYSIANATAPPSSPTVGFAYIDILGGGSVLEWDGAEWISIGPTRDGEYWYVSDDATWYQWSGTVWVALIGAPDIDPDAATFDYIYTMAYKVRTCNQSIMHVVADLVGLDCANFFHGIGTGIFAGVGIVSAFQYDFKIRGSLQVEEMPVDRELTKNNRLIRTISGTRARVRTWATPAVVMRLIQAAATDDGFTIDGTTWAVIEAMKRNNDNGIMWYLNVLVGRDDCKADAPC